MKKLVLILGIVFVTMSSFTIESDPVDCDQLALDWYEQTLAGGYGQAHATFVYNAVLGQCYLDGGSSQFNVDIK